MNTYYVVVDGAFVSSVMAGFNPDVKILGCGSITNTNILSIFYNVTNAESKLPNNLQRLFE